MIAVEVESLRIRSRAHPADRSELEWPVALREALVAVGVVDRCDEEGQRRQPVVVLAGHQVAEQHQQRFLAAHLAAVNVGLQPHAGAVGRRDR